MIEAIHPILTRMEAQVSKIRYSLLAAAVSLIPGLSNAQHDPLPVWSGKAEKTLAESTPFKTERAVKVPDGAPNVVCILLDDVGFGTISPF